MTFDRESGSSDALLTDLYLDALLAGVVLDAAAAGGPGAAPGGLPDAGRLDPAVRRAADRLRHDLVRVHPSFRFEERLATRLAEAAAAMRVQVAAGGEGRLVAFRTGPAGSVDPDLFPTDDGAGAHDDPLTGPSAEPFGGEGGPARRGAGRPLLIGGALTSAALSIAGAAFVAWRFGRPGRASTPMARAARAVRDARLAAALETTLPAGRAPRRLD